MSAPFLDVESIEAIYGASILALREVSLSVAEGEIVALIGPNGAGKTTTLRAISNLLGAQRGHVRRGTIRWRGASTRPTSLPAASCRCWRAATSSASSRWRRIWLSAAISAV